MGNSCCETIESSDEITIIKDRSFVKKGTLPYADADLYTSDVEQDTDDEESVSFPSQDSSGFGQSFEESTEVGQSENASNPLCAKEKWEEPHLHWGKKRPQNVFRSQKL